MKTALTIGGALLALAVFATTADARMMGGMGMSSASMSHGNVQTMPSSFGSTHSFSPDGHSLGSAGRGFSPDGLPQRVKGSNWKKPIDADNGGPSDPPKPPKPPKVRTFSDAYPYGQHHHYYGYGPYGWYHPHH